METNNIEMITRMVIQAMEKTKPGEFSDRVWTLNNRRLYRKKD